MTQPWLLPLGGGILIGLTAALLWLLSGRIAGVSGIVGGLSTAPSEDRSWRIAFLLGLVTGGIALGWATPESFAATPLSLGGLVIAGGLVGVGTTLANGCTSGHGVCGIARLSPRSLVATATFMGTAGIVVYVVRHLIGGAA